MSSGLKKKISKLHQCQNISNPQNLLKEVMNIPSREIGEKKKRLKTVCNFELVCSLVTSVTAYISHQQPLYDKKINQLTTLSPKIFLNYCSISKGHSLFFTLFEWKNSKWQSFSLLKLVISHINCILEAKFQFEDT